KFEIVPKINHPDYVEIIIEICKKHDIQAIFSLIDPELELLARNKEKFDKENVQLILSDEKTIDICFDKYKTSIYLDNNAIQSVPTYRDLTIVQKKLSEDKLSYPLVVKPAKGSASMGLFIVNTEDELE